MLYCDRTGSLNCACTLYNLKNVLEVIFSLGKFPKTDCLSKYLFKFNNKDIKTNSMVVFTHSRNGIREILEL